MRVFIGFENVILQLGFYINRFITPASATPNNRGKPLLVAIWVLSRALHNTRDIRLYAPSEGRSNNGASALFKDPRVKTGTRTYTLLTNLCTRAILSSVSSNFLPYLISGLCGPCSNLTSKKTIPCRVIHSC